jgi:hypothetical protein
MFGFIKGGGALFIYGAFTTPKTIDFCQVEKLG